MENKLNLFFRLLTFGSALALLWPTVWMIHLAGLVALICIFILNRRATQGGETGGAVLAA